MMEDGRGGSGEGGGCWRSRRTGLMSVTLLKGNFPQFDTMPQSQPLQGRGRGGKKMGNGGSLPVAQNHF